MPPAPPPMVPVLVSSKHDMPHCEKIVKELQFLGIDSFVRLASAQKSPERVLQMLKQFEAMPNPKVYVCAAGRTNALAGLIDGAVKSPVIACPPYSDTFA